LRSRSEMEREERGRIGLPGCHRVARWIHFAQGRGWL
jgi:hypothetical protein